VKRYFDQRRWFQRNDEGGPPVSAVVTGGGSGFGRAVVGLLRAAGHDVVAWDLRHGDIDCDISDPDAVAAAIVATLEPGWVTGQVIHADGGLALHSPIDAFGHGQPRKNS
jgi:NAD(P)-dependent dehydrogenase (short-subunit alcohol dehydrogenase family)